MREERNKQLSVIELAEKDWILPLSVIYRSQRTLSIAAKKFVQLLAADSQKTQKVDANLLNFTELQVISTLSQKTS
jgi:hypothetical protein